MLPPEQVAHLMAELGTLYAVLAVRLCSPALYRARRNTLMLGLRLLFPCVTMGMDFARVMGARELVESTRPGVSLAHFWFVFLCSSASLQMMLPALSSPLPPLTNSCLAAGSVLLAACSNPKLCASPFGVHPITARRLEGLASVLGPLAAAVEWPLAALGAPHAALPCHSGESLTREGGGCLYSPVCGLAGWCCCCL